MMSKSETMRDFFCDMHVHIGATSRGTPVKITASRKLTLESIIRESLSRKGMDMVCVVDCAAPGVLGDIRRLVSEGQLCQHSDGGFLHRDQLAVIMGSEVETVEPHGGVSHHVSVFPDLKTISEFSRVMSRYISNMELSSQRARLRAGELYDVTKATGGILIPAHVFTPHKSLYGNAGRRMSQVIDREKDAIIAVELGLSADTSIADHLEELAGVTFLSNSDAHSTQKIAREYNIIKMQRPCFKEFVLALHRRAGRRVVANVGMDPRLGRYHRTYCLQCDRVQTDPPPVLDCRFCGAGGKEVVRGVYDRIREIGDYDSPRHPSHRPPYRYQVPLMFIPGMNIRTMDYLMERFGSEMAILNLATDAEIRQALSGEMARNLIDARNGKLKIDSGGGGNHGRLKKREVKYDQLSLFT